MQMLRSLVLGLTFFVSAGMANDDAALWVDVRTASEYQRGHVEGALNIEFGDIVAGLAQRGVSKDTEILLYCGSGRRAGIAKESLQSEGYQSVQNVGGIEEALRRADSDSTAAP